MYPIIISCYTKNTLYEEEIKDLARSCKNLNLEFSFVGYKSLGSWEKNCCFKAKFILKKIKELKKPILWVDADGLILKKPVFDDSFFNSDISICPKYASKKIISLHSGTIFINYTKNAISLLKAWDKECQMQLNDSKREGEVWDQRCLYELIFEKDYPTKFSPLPEKYCYIFDRKYDESIRKDISIIHFQTSRIAKKFVNDNLEIPAFLKNLPPLELKKIRLENLYSNV
jgi:hypothetical protein